MYKNALEAVDKSIKLWEYMAKYDELKATAYRELDFKRDVNLCPLCQYTYEQSKKVNCSLCPSLIEFNKYQVNKIILDVNKYADTDASVEAWCEVMNTPFSQWTLDKIDRKPQKSDPELAQEFTELLKQTKQRLENESIK